MILIDCFKLAGSIFYCEGIEVLIKRDVCFIYVYKAKLSESIGKYIKFLKDFDVRYGIYFK